MDEYERKRNGFLDLSEWMDYSPGDKIPQQQNGYDCGVFMCIFAHFVLHGLSFKFNQQDMQFCRKHMILEIMQAKQQLPLKRKRAFSKNDTTAKKKPKTTATPTASITHVARKRRPAASGKDATLYSNYYKLYGNGVLPVLQNIAESDRSRSISSFLGFKISAEYFQRRDMDKKPYSKYQFVSTADLKKFQEQDQPQISVEMVNKKCGTIKTDGIWEELVLFYDINRKLCYLQNGNA